MFSYFKIDKYGQIPSKNFVSLKSSKHKVYRDCVQWVIHSHVRNGGKASVVIKKKNINSEYN